MTIFERVLTSMLKYMPQEDKAGLIDKILEDYCMYPVGNKIHIFMGSGNCNECPFARFPKCWEEEARFLLKDTEDVKGAIIKGGIEHGTKGTDQTVKEY